MAADETKVLAARFRAVLLGKDGGGIEELVGQGAGSGEPLSRWIVFAPPSRVACSAEAVYNEGLDRVAENIHNTCRGGHLKLIAAAEKAGDTVEVTRLQAKPANKPWHDLTEEQKDDNRFAADHIEVKIRAAEVDTSDPGTSRSRWESLSPKTIDMLSRVEHERWCAVKWMGGWKLGPRDDEKRTHTDLVPFDQLSTGTREFDVDQVRAAVGHLSGRDCDKAACCLIISAV